MTLYEALAASWVSKAGCRGAWLGDLEAMQDAGGEIILYRLQVVNGSFREWPTPPLAEVSHRTPWEPWGEQGTRGEKR